MNLDILNSNVKHGIACNMESIIDIANFTVFDEYFAHHNLIQVCWHHYVDEPWLIPADVIALMKYCDVKLLQSHSDYHSKFTFVTSLPIQLFINKLTKVTDELRAKHKCKSSLLFYVL